MGMRIYPVHFDRLPCNAHRLGVVVLGRERMVRRQRHSDRQQTQATCEDCKLGFHVRTSCFVAPTVYQFVPVSNKIEAMSEEPNIWPWPDSLDALMAAPKHHQLVLDNERVRVLDTRIPAGDVVPVHTHRWPAVYYTISGGDFVRYDAEGKVLLDTRIQPNPT